MSPAGWLLLWMMLALLMGVGVAVGFIVATADATPVERGLGYVAAAIVLASLYRAGFNK